jgi:hypothetical protein
MPIVKALLTLAYLFVIASAVEAQRPQASGRPRERLVTGGDSTLLSGAHRRAVTSVVAEQMRDPASLSGFRILLINAVIQADTFERFNACGEYNAKNGYGGYVGRSYFVVRKRAPRSDSLTANRDSVLLWRTDGEPYRKACFDLGSRQTASWVASDSQRRVFRVGCLAARRVMAADRRYFWTLAEAEAAGFAPSSAPGCQP